MSSYASAGRMVRFPWGMQDANFVALNKNKDERSACDNCRGIAFLSIARKAYAQVVVKRLQTITDVTLNIDPSYSGGKKLCYSTISYVKMLGKNNRKGKTSVHYYCVITYFMTWTTAFILVLITSDKPLNADPPHSCGKKHCYSTISYVKMLGKNNRKGKTSVHYYCVITYFMTWTMAFTLVLITSNKTHNGDPPHSCGKKLCYSTISYVKMLGKNNHKGETSVHYYCVITYFMTWTMAFILVLITSDKPLNADPSYSCGKKHCYSTIS